MVENKKNPTKVYKAGVLQLSLWENKTEEGDIVRSFTIQRSYKDKDDKWQHTTNIRSSDLPRLRVLIDEAYKDLIMK